MPEALESVSSPPVETKEENFQVVETEGAVGDVGPGRSDVADDFLVYGSTPIPIVQRGFRRGNETVIGVDERNLIKETDKYPWRMIAALSLIPRPPLSNTYIGTAWFIGPKTLLTAGHCVYSKSDFGGWIGRIEVSPGRYGSKFPFKTVTATRFSALKVWEDSADPDFDVGCIHLDAPLEETVGHFKIASPTDAELAERLVNVSGYPGDRGGGKEQYFHRNRLLKVTARRLYYDVDTYGGQSGSPVWIQNGPKDEPVAIGVHAYGVSSEMTANSGPRLRPEVVATIQKWLADDAK